MYQTVRSGMCACIRVYVLVWMHGLMKYIAQVHITIELPLAS